MRTLDFWNAAPYNLDIKELRFLSLKYTPYDKLQKLLTYEEWLELLEWRKVMGIGLDQDIRNDIYWDDQRYRPNEEGPELIVTIGLPGIGKSTYVKEHSNNRRIFSRDDLVECLGLGESYSDKFHWIRENDLTREINSIFQKQLLTYCQPAILDVTFLNTAFRKFVFEKLNKIYKIKFWLFMDTLPNAWERNLKREGKVVPKEAFLKMANNIIVPPSTYDIKVINMWKGVDRNDINYSLFKSGI